MTALYWARYLFLVVLLAAVAWLVAVAVSEWRRQ
jgi:hypothetical protein